MPLPGLQLAVMQVRRRRAISLCKQMLIRSFTEVTATAAPAAKGTRP